MKNWADDIRTKTKHMDRNAKTEYILNYYWYHILLGFLILGLLILGVYHVTWGKKKTEFSLVIVNQEINAKRDRQLREEFADFSSIPEKQIQADSDYMISYGDVQLEGINESSYEKFFFGWSAGAIDAVIMPESFYHYCQEQNGRFLPLAQLANPVQSASEKQFASEKQSESGKQSESEELFLKEDGVCYGVYVEHSNLSAYFIDNADDPYVLVFPTEAKHQKAAGRFLEYAWQSGQEET